MQDVPEWLGYIDRIVVCINNPLYMAFVGGVDAIPSLKYKWKAFGTGIVAIFYTFLLINYYFLIPDEQDYEFEIKATGSLISIRSVEANVLGTLTLFLWKQTIDIMRNKGRCVSIIYRPYLRWHAIQPDVSNAATVVVESAT